MLHYDNRNLQVKKGLLSVGAHVEVATITADGKFKLLDAVVMADPGVDGFISVEFTEATSAGTAWGRKCYPWLRGRMVRDWK